MDFFAFFEKVIFDYTCCKNVSSCTIIQDFFNGLYNCGNAYGQNSTEKQLVCNNSNKLEIIPLCIYVPYVNLKGPGSEG
jgi:hypothetical protein